MLQLIKVKSINDLTIEQLIKESEHEGFDFVTTLYKEYENQMKTFNGPNDLLLVAMNEYGKTLAIGSVSVDSNQDDTKIGCIQNVYVLQGYRRMGIGKTLVQGLLDFSNDHYKCINLKSVTEESDIFIENFGFNKNKCEHKTHELTL